MYLLDTNICVAVIKGERAVLDAFKPRRNDCALPIIVVSELYKGAYCSTKIASNLKTINGLIRRLPIINFDSDAAEDSGRIQSELRKIGRPTGDMDALIGAIARSNSATLVTHNTADFQSIQGLKLEDWLS
ncbi:MAG: type II toxin-antitoxin system VapC family toxin [Phormidesmis sp.]